MEIIRGYTPGRYAGRVTPLYLSWCGGDPAPVLPRKEPTTYAPDELLWLDLDSIPLIDPFAMQRVRQARTMRLVLSASRGAPPNVFNRFASRERRAA